MADVIPGWEYMTPAGQEVYAANIRTIDAIKESGGSLSRNEPIYGGASAFQELLKDHPSVPQQYIPELEKIAKAEGYTRGIYDDTKGYITTGAGQTGSFAGMTPLQSVTIHEDRAKSVFPNYHLYDPETQSMLLDAAYRGDLRYGPKSSKSGQPQKWTNLFREGKYADAAKEHINHAEYKKDEVGGGIRKRFDARADEMMRLEGLRGVPEEAWGRGIQPIQEVPPTGAPSRNTNADGFITSYPYNEDAFLGSTINRTIEGYRSAEDTLREFFSELFGDKDE